jgi:hypothetical protein
MSFFPYNRPLKIQEYIETLILKVRAHLGMWGFISSHFPTLLGTWNVTFGLHFWPAPLQALTLIESPKLKLRHHSSSCFSLKLLLFFRNVNFILPWCNSCSSSTLFLLFLNVVFPFPRHYSSSLMLLLLFFDATLAPLWSWPYSFRTIYFSLILLLFLLSTMLMFLIFQSGTPPPPPPSPPSCFCRCGRRSMLSKFKLFSFRPNLKVSVFLFSKCLFVCDFWSLF